MNAKVSGKQKLRVVWENQQPATNLPWPIGLQSLFATAGRTGSNGHNDDIGHVIHALKGFGATPAFVHRAALPPPSPCAAPCMTFVHVVATCSSLLTGLWTCVGLQARHIALTERNTGLRIYVLDNSGSTAAMDGKTYTFDEHSNTVTKCSCTRCVRAGDLGHYQH